MRGNKAALLVMSLLFVCSLLWGVAASFISFTVGTTPGNPAAGKFRLWGNSTTGYLECLNSSGANCFNTMKSCDVIVGDASGAVITNAQLGPQAHACRVPIAATVLEISVESDAGSPSVIVGRRRCTTFTSGTCSAETVVNLVSSALAVSSGFAKCSNTGGTTGLETGTTCTNTLQNTSLSAGDWVELVSGTAGGTAKLMTIHTVYANN